MKSEKNINLVHPILGVRGFSVEHARNVMGMKRNGGWEYNSDEDRELVEGKKEEIEENVESVEKKVVKKTNRKKAVKKK